jgi:hypothetical protein
MTKAPGKALNRTLDALRRPGAKLVRLHGRKDECGYFAVLIPHGSFKVPDAVAAEILAREDVQPLDPGLPHVGGPQSWAISRGAP